jgi:hypothetical protein
VAKEANQWKEAKKALYPFVWKQLQDYYTPLRRLEYYENDYSSGELQLVFPPWGTLTIINHVPSSFSSTQKKELEQQLTALLGKRCETAEGEPPLFRVQWEGKEVFSRVVFRFICDSSYEFRRLIDKSEPERNARSKLHLLHEYLWEAVGSDHLRVDAIKARWERAKLAKLRHFYETQNVWLCDRIIVVNSIEELNISQLYEPLRQNLPESFPLFEEFEANVPLRIRRKAAENLNALMASSGGYGNSAGIQSFENSTFDERYKQYKTQKENEQKGSSWSIWNLNPFKPMLFD